MRVYKSKDIPIGINIIENKANTKDVPCNKPNKPKDKIKPLRIIFDDLIFVLLIIIYPLIYL